METHSNFLKIYPKYRDKLIYLEDLDFCADTSTVFKNASKEDKKAPKDSLSLADKISTNQ